jgi:riboflavin kinase/FMN adenylyltransferase
MSPPLIATIGKFDALHRGHRRLVSVAAELGRPLVVSFAGMAEVLGWPPRLPIVPVGDRPRILASWGRELEREIEQLELPFQAVRGLEPAAFVDLLREVHGCGGIVTGASFRFVRDRSGGAADLQRLCAVRGMAARAVEILAMAAAPVSSSRVRHELAAGAVETVTELLGRPHRVLGVVERCHGRGRQLGFPTANCGQRLNLAAGPGVYAARAWIDDEGPIPAAVNIGHLPTLGEDRPLSVEAHLLDWTRDCYGARIGLDLVARIRDEQRFEGLEALRGQIGRDVGRAREVLEKASLES